MLDETAQGVFTIAVTPFLPDGGIDWDSVDRMVDFYIAQGATGLTILGMMGEAGKLSADESIAVVKRVIARSTVPDCRGRLCTGVCRNENAVRCGDGSRRRRCDGGTPQQPARPTTRS